MTVIADKIKTRGYWSVVIRPIVFVENRIENYSTLFPLVQRLSVRVRGWDFPHIGDNEKTIRGRDWIGQEIDWDNVVESWRFYQSGHFAYLGGYWIDWTNDTAIWSPKPPEPYREKIIGVSDIAARYFEFFKFASGLALSEAGSERIYIRIEAHKLAGRYLWVDSNNRFPFRFPYTATVESFPQEAEFDRDTLIASSSSLSENWAKQLYQRFGWEPTDGLIKSMRKDFALYNID